MTGNSSGWAGLDISFRQLCVLCGLALLGCFTLVAIFMRTLFWLIEHLRWVP